MKNREDLEQEFSALVAKAKTEKRSLTADEDSTLDNIKKEIESLDNAQKLNEQLEKRETELRSIKEKQDVSKARTSNVDKNTYLRSLAKGSADVGNKEVIADVVRVFETESPLWAAHQNIQRRATGNTYSFTKVTMGGAAYIKTEGDAGTADSASAATIVPVAFVTYTGQKILITQEALDDYAADLSQEVVILGNSKVAAKVDEALAAELEDAFVSIPETSTAEWLVSDLSEMYFEIPVRNRVGVKYICHSSTAAQLVTLLTGDAAPQLAAIKFSAENLVISDNITEGVVICCNPTLALAVAMKEPVRTVVLQVSEGSTYEVQPRVAIALRDASACSARSLLIDPYA